jgi:aryl-alcohol dehydrogenase-like predicted oxidoreductase
LGVERLDGLLLHNPSEEILRRADIADCLAALVRDRTARHVGASVASLDEVKAALAIPAVTMLQVPIAVAGMIAQSDCLAEIKHRRVAVFVREVLRTPAGPALAKGEVGPALRSAIAPDFVTAVIIGVSTRHHLAGLVAALP